MKDKGFKAVWGVLIHDGHWLIYCFHDWKLVSNGILLVKEGKQNVEHQKPITKATHSKKYKPKGL